MKNYLIVLLPVIFLMTITACEKDEASPSKNDGTFPENTIWIGTAQPISRSYDKPCGLKIKEDNTVTLYGIFNFLIDGSLSRRDSVSGNIKAIANTSSGTTASLEFPEIEETFDILISQNNTLVRTSPMGANEPNFFSLNLELYTSKVFSLDGTSWSGKVMKGGAVEGYLAYPDLSTVNFSISASGVKNTFYSRNNELAKIGVPQTGDFIIVQSVYQQSGPFVWMNGFNENKGTLIYYFGIISNTNDKMWVDSVWGARLTSPVDTYEYYGPRGVTPVIYKQ